MNKADEIFEIAEQTLSDFTIDKHNATLYFTLQPNNAEVKLDFKRHAYEIESPVEGMYSTSLFSKALDELYRLLNQNNVDAEDEYALFVEECYKLLSWKK